MRCTSLLSTRRCPHSAPRIHIPSCTCTSPACIFSPPVAVSRHSPHCPTILCTARVRHHFLSKHTCPPPLHAPASVLASWMRIFFLAPTYSPLTPPIASMLLPLASSDLPDLGSLHPLSLMPPEPSMRTHPAAPGALGLLSHLNICAHTANHHPVPIIWENARF